MKYQTSLIQRRLDEERIISAFKNAIHQLNENFVCNDNVFTINDNGQPVEVTEGFLAGVKRYDSINEALKNYYGRQQGIRIYTDGDATVFEVGYLTKDVYDIEKMKTI